MKKLLIVFGVFTCFYLSAKAQVDESRNFVYFYSDSVFYAQNIRLRTDFFNSLQLRADSKRIPLKQIKFFNNDEGFFANTKELNALGQIRLSERIIAGKINLYQDRPEPTFSYDLRPMYRDQGAVDIRMFYNKGYGDLKKVNYNNLKIDMAGRAESMDFLENYRKNVNTGKILYVAAGASAAAALVSFLVSTKNKDKLPNVDSFHDHTHNLNSKNGNFTVSIVLFGLGAGLAIGGYSANRSGLRKLEGAIDAYNK